MVNVSTSVELDGTLKGDLLLGVVGLEGGGVIGLSLVEVGDVGLMMLLVMKRHDRFTDRGGQVLSLVSQYMRMTI